MQHITNLATWQNQNKNTAPVWENQEKSHVKLFGDLTANDIGRLAPTDILPGTIPEITLGEATPSTKIYSVWTNQNKSATPVWTNQTRN